MSRLAQLGAAAAVAVAMLAPSAHASEQRLICRGPDQLLIHTSDFDVYGPTFYKC